MKISEIITDKYKLRLPPTVYYDLLADVQEAEEEQKPKTGHWIMPQNDDGMSDPICYQVRCSECGFDLDPQTYCEELERVDANGYCPKCGAKMVEPKESED